MDQKGGHLVFNNSVLYDSDSTIFACLFVQATMVLNRTVPSSLHPSQWERRARASLFVQAQWYSTIFTLLLVRADDGTQWYSTIFGKVGLPVRPSSMVQCHLHLTLGPSRRPPLLAFNSLPFLVSAHCCLFLVSRLCAAHCCRLFLIVAAFFLIVAAFFSHPPKHVHTQKRTLEEVTSSWGVESIEWNVF